MSVESRDGEGCLEGSWGVCQTGRQELCPETNPCMNKSIKPCLCGLCVCE